MRQRGVIWVVLAGMLAGFAGVAVVAATDSGSGKPSRLPALSLAGAGMGRDAAASSSMPAQAAGVEYRVEGDLPELPDRARVWRVGSAVSASEVARVATVLGVSGEPQRDGDAWVVHGGDAGELRVEAFPGGPWSFSRRSPDCTVSSDGSTTCPKEAVGVGGTGAAGAAGGSPDGEPAVAAGSTGATDAYAPPYGAQPPVAPNEPPATTVEPCPMPDCPPDQACAQVCPRPEPVPPPVPERPADLPSKAEAERLARGWWDALGVDLEGGTVTVDDGFSQWVVTASPRVGGLTVEARAWTIAVGPEGRLEWANGWIAEPEQGDEYPLAGVDAGLARLRSGESWWGLGAPVPLAASDMPLREGGDGGKVVRTVTGVELGLVFAPVFSRSGPPPEALLIPAYVFTLDDGGRIAVLAVADEYLPTPPASEPMPEPAPTEPGTAKEGCVGAGASGDPAVEVCGPGSFPAGEEHAFTLRIHATEGSWVTADCAAPALVWGDEAGAGRAVCDIGCAPAPADAPTTKWEGTFTHAYDKPGKYEIRSSIVSCGGTTFPEVRFPVEVVAP